MCTRSRVRDFVFNPAYALWIFPLHNSQSLLRRTTKFRDLRKFLDELKFQRENCIENKLKIIGWSILCNFHNNRAEIKISKKEKKGKNTFEATSVFVEKSPLWNDSWCWPAHSWTDRWINNPDPPLRRVERRKDSSKKIKFPEREREGGREKKRTGSRPTSGPRRERPHAFLFSAWLSGAETAEPPSLCTSPLPTPLPASCVQWLSGAWMQPGGEPRCSVDTNTSTCVYFHYRGRVGDNNRAPLARATRDRDGERGRGRGWEGSKGVRAR